MSCSATLQDGRAGSTRWRDSRLSGLRHLEPPSFAKATEGEPEQGAQIAKAIKRRVKGGKRAASEMVGCRCALEPSSFAKAAEDEPEQGVEKINTIGCKIRICRVYCA